jgi:epoxyqueuosine reductase
MQINNLIDFLNNLQVSFWGISKHENGNYLKSMPCLITLGVRLSDAIIDEIDNQPTFTYFNHYRSVNSYLDHVALKTAMILQDSGFKAYTIAASQSIPDPKIKYSGVFPHKTGAVLSGMGWIGMNGLFIHKDYGPRVRLVTILTDMEIMDLPINNSQKSIGNNLSLRKKSESVLNNRIYDNLIENLNSEKAKINCVNCNKCVKACPAMAIKGVEWYPGISRDEIIDAKACSEYMNQKFKHIGRGSVCGICIKVCNNHGM